MKVSSALILTVTLTALTGYAQEEVTVSTVAIWVKATAGGKPALGLTEKDFAVYEDNTPQQITCFEEIKQPQIYQAEGSAPSSVSSEQQQTTKPAHKFVLFLDLMNITPAEMSTVKPRLKDFVAQLKAGNYQVMVVALVPPGKMGIASPYTTDLMRISTLVEQAPPNPARDNEARQNESRILDTLKQLQSEEETPVDSLDDLTRVSPRTEMNTRIMKVAYQLARSYTNQERQRSEFALRALETFGNYLAKQSKDDHTVIVYVSGGFNGEPGRRYYELIDQYLLRKGFQADSMVFNVRVSENKRDDNFDLLTMVKKSVGRLNRQNVTLYSINTRGLVGVRDNIRQTEYESVDESKILPDFQDSLRQIANETGGMSFQNTQNFKLSFDQLISDLGHQYVLCYTPPAHSRKGQYHQIKVVSKRSGVAVRHRNGYFD